MTIYGFLSFLAFFLYLQLGLFVLISKPNSKLNRTFFYLCATLLIWSFGSIFIQFSPDSSAVKYWSRVSSFGWTFFPVFLVNFFLVLKKRVSYLLSNLIKVTFMLLSSIFFFQSLIGKLLVNDHSFYDGVWHSLPNLNSGWYWGFLGYLVLSLSVTLYLLISWGLTCTTIKERKQVRIIMVTLLLFFTGVLMINYVLPIINIGEAPNLIHIFSIIWVIGFGYAVVKYKFLVLSPETAANEIISKMKELLFFLDTEGNIVKINHFTSQILGFDREEILNKPFESLLVDEKEAQGRIAKLEPEELSKNKESYLRQKNGDVIPFNLSSAEVKDEAGDILGTIIVGYDVRYEKMLEEEIVLRKKTESALRESEKRHRDLYNMVRLMCDNVPDLIWAKDLNRRYIFANKATCENLLNAKDTDEPIGKTELYFFTREKESQPHNKIWFTYGDICVDSDNITLRNREPGRYVEFGNIRGKYTYHDVYKAPFWDEYGNLIGIVGCGRDITQEKRVEEERRIAEKALESEKELLSVTLKSIEDAVISTDTNGRLILMNKAAEELTGWDSQSAWGRNIQEIYHVVDSRTKEKMENPIQKVLKTEKGVSSHYDVVLIRKDGHSINITENAAPIKNKDGVIIGVVLVFSDITDKQKMEQELAKVQKLETVGLLAGGIAHDFNNILTAITGNISLSILQLKGAPEISQRLLEAEKACFRARDLTHQLLTFSKGGSPVKKVVRVERVVKETALFAVSGSNAECIFNIAEDIHYVEVDESQICQVINNIVINAKQAMPSGGSIIVSIENVDIPADLLPLGAGSYVKIAISDTGTGISPKYLSKIFDPFFTTKQAGSGIGLTSSFSIIKRHGGHITVDSTEGKGTLFSIYLPASEKVVEEVKEKSFKLDFKGTGNVLIMDDDEEIRETLGIMIESLGYSVFHSINGEEAIDQYKDARGVGQNFEFVILDLTIPGGLGGKETIEELRKIDYNVKAIVSSGYSSDPIIANYKSFGFNSVMVKPYNMADLVEAIKSL